VGSMDLCASVGPTLQRHLAHGEGRWEDRRCSSWKSSRPGSMLRSGPCQAIDGFPSSPDCRECHTEDQGNGQNSSS
jgi:hypothetical protein